MTDRKIGSITLIIGNMYSGKTSLLIAKYDQNKNYRRCMTFKPTLDNRYGVEKIQSHNGEVVRATPINKIEDLEKYKNQFDVAFIDELHFFARNKDGTPNLIVNQYLNELANQDKEIICAGLTWDCFADEPFLGVSHLVATCEYPIRLFGKCDVEDCYERSTKQKWKLDWLPKKPEDFVGGAEKYGSYCRFHYTPPKGIEAKKYK